MIYTAVMEPIAANPPGEACETCRYWHRDRADERPGGWGQCRRMPPAAPPIEPDRLVHVGVWPSTRQVDWCGEWRSVDG